MRRNFIESHQELKVYQIAFEAAMRVFELSREFPQEERGLIVHQVVRSSRSVCANLAEAWRKRRYKAAFIAKLNDAEAEAAESPTWIEFAVMCSYLDSETGQELYQNYNDILAGIERLIDNADTWVIRKPSKNPATDETETK